MSLPPVPLLSCTCTPGTLRSTSRTFCAPLSSISRRRTTLRAPGWFCTTAWSASPSQSPTTVTVPSSLASSSACAACMDTPSAMATARRDNELTDDIEAPPGTQEKVGRKITANRKERKYK
jgi:hypothetical protein